MQKTKYLIIGQGLAGSLLSWELKKKNLDHVLISSFKKPVASLVAAGMYNPLVFKRLTKSWLVDDLLPVMQSTYSELEKELGKKLLYKKKIAKLIHPDEKTWWTERINNQQLDTYFESFNENHFIPGLHPEFEIALIKNSGFVNLNIFINSYANYLKARKQLIIDEFSYHEMHFSKQGVLYKDIEAETLIFCDGAQAIHNPFFPDSIFYLTKGDVLTVEIKDFTDTYILNKDIFILPRGGNHYMIGSTYQHENLNLDPQKENLDYLLNKASQLISKAIKIIGHQVGIRPTVKDRRPILGFHHEIKNLAFFNGLGTKGVMLAPYFAKEMAALLSNPEQPILPEVSIKRFYKE